MRISSLFLAVALSACAGLFSVVGCSSDDGNTTSTTTTSTSTSGASSSGGSSSSGSASTSGTSGSSSSGGSDEYNTCGECSSGSATKECATHKTNCDKDQGCVDIYNCVYGLAGSAGCSTDKDGGCCTVKCYADAGASMASINLYKSFDACVYCTTCKTLCTDGTYDATGYCSVVQSANPTCP